MILYTDRFKKLDFNNIKVKFEMKGYSWNKLSGKLSKSMIYYRVLWLRRALVQLPLGSH